ncbi:MAG TPA: class I SAM-dependent methyltransferase [Solidesulfovibrio magneticus]|nr:class I SAM-dependent methyltransferase [Solidesulfovibrio magneticus]
MGALPVRLFDLIANLFYNDEVKSAIKNAVSPSHDLAILDAPCGTGILTPLCLPSQYTGIDLDADRIASAKERYAGVGSFFVADAAKLDFPGASFDVILASGLFHHLDDVTVLRVLAEFSRVLKPRGRLVVFEAIWPLNRLNVLGYVMRRMDKGKFVRHAAEFENMFKQYFTISSGRPLNSLCLDYDLKVMVPHGEEDKL